MEHLAAKGTGPRSSFTGSQNEKWYENKNARGAEEKSG